jgi:uncharacterized protein YjhX (UPF0386 family)
VVKVSLRQFGGFYAATAEGFRYLDSLRLSALGFLRRDGLQLAACSLQLFVAATTFCFLPSAFSFRLSALGFPRRDGLWLAACSLQLFVAATTFCFLPSAFGFRL